MQRVWHVALLASMSAVTLLTLQRKQRLRQESYSHSSEVCTSRAGKKELPNAHRMELSIAGSFSHNGLYAQALAIYSRLLQTALDEVPRRRAHLSHLYDLRSCVYESLQCHDNVVQDTTAALQFDASLGDLYLRRGIALAHLHQYREALRDILMAIELAQRADEDVTDLNEMFRALEQEAIFYEARDAMQNCSPRHLPDDYLIRAYHDNFYASDMDTEYSSLIYELAHTSSDRGVQFLQQALHNKESGRFIECYEDLQEAISNLHPHHAFYVIVCMEYACFLHLLQRYKEAADWFKQCIDRLPQSTWIQAHRIHNLLIQGCRAGAASALAMAPNESPTFSFLRGLFHSRIFADSVQALQHFHEAIRLAPDYVAPYYAASQIYLSANLHEAHSILHQCLAWQYLYSSGNHPALAWIHYALGKYETLCGRSAVVNFEASIAADTTFVPAYIGLARQYPTLFERAQAYLMQALVYARRPDPGILLAQLRFENQRWQHAVDACDQALEYATTYVEYCHIYAVRNVAIAKVMISNKQSVP
ncbi:hypothetical protein THRCLA_11207 [Thraustotheca clavata]|uniref:Secreted protein n=1 Tax=Thraustotheca clavata TaxID=74557 RepID=A0A1V9Y8I9_9STRA|nr:hypothetical protein THRCLA_11207 [Thraustotheca clavata]